MHRLVEFIETEFEIVEAVWSRRIRSLVLFLAALVMPTVVVLVAMRLLETLPVPGFTQGIAPMVPTIGLVLMLKLLFVAIQTYLKDRAALLRF